MALRIRITELPGIEHPIVEGGMMRDAEAIIANRLTSFPLAYERKAA